MPMKFNGFRRHPELANTHAPFGASKYSWVRYDDAKMLETYSNLRAAQRGTELHDWAHEAVRLGQKQPKTQQTIPMYINDCLGHRMSNEVVLYHSPLFYGSADACKFEEAQTSDARHMLRIFDLKTGVVPAHAEQLIIYAALFCLEYKFDPFDLDYDLRIYQNDERIYLEVDPQDIMDTMIRIQSGTELILNNQEVL